MSRTILLDSGPLGLATNPGGSAAAADCAQWLREAAGTGASVVVPEIADYEVRRELIRARRTTGIARLDALIARIDYLAITTSAMRQAATLDRRDVIVATTNTRHLSRFVDAALWSDIA